MKKVVLAYSGGLDTSVAVAWLREQFGVEVVTLTVDVGGGSLRTGVEGRAISAGASRAYVVDARKTFVRDFCWPSLQANARYQAAQDWFKAHNHLVISSGPYYLNTYDAAAQFAELDAFRDALTAELGVPVGRRYSGGRDIHAACGMLAGEWTRQE